MSDTPRTDNVIQQALGAGLSLHEAGLVNLARTFERDLVAARAYAEQMRAALYALFNASGRAEQYEAGKLARAALANHQPKEK